MSPLTVRRWRKYGHDRLYVEGADGLKLGYWDLLTGRAQVDHPAHRAELDAAIQQHLAGLAGVSAPVQPAPPSSPTTTVVAPAVPSQPTWTDLSTNRPGQAALARAAEERAAAPVRTVLARVLGVKTDERAWRIGGRGEEEVAERLRKLGPAWSFLHAVPVGKGSSDIDHIAIGPGGVYTINTKHHPDGRIVVKGDAFYLNGKPTRYVRNSRFEADRAERYLSTELGWPVPVTGVIAVMGATGGFTVKEQPHDGRVHVVRRKEIDTWLGKRRSSFTVEQLAAIFEIARRDTTWRQ